jgi:hypothetical protein
VSGLRALVANGQLDAELAALVWLLAERGVPLVVASADQEVAGAVRRAFSAQVLGAQPGRDAVAGGVVIGRSLEDVLRRLGDSGEGGPSDASRDIGVVLVLDAGRVAAAHYVRPVERDAAGHLQRRPPAVLSSWNAAAGALDHFYWAVTDELATRAAMTRHELEDDHERRTAALSAPAHDA